MSAVDFSKKSLIFITGASRGIGRCIAVEISRKLNPQSAMVLVASSKPKLEETRSMIQAVNSGLNVITIPLDLSHPSEEVYEKLFDDVLEKVDLTELGFSMFVHNAATLGVLKKILELNDIDMWKKYFDLNIVSAISLNNIFVKKIHNLCEKLIVLNITSLAGREPHLNMSMYGSGKAAREILFKVFALEEPNINVLNYSPGPVDTDMFNTLADTVQDDQFRKALQGVRDSTMLSPQQTVDKLMSILQKGDYKSGETIDYYDRA